MKKMILLVAASFALLATSCCNCEKNNKCQAGEEAPIEAEMRPMHHGHGGSHHGPRDMKPECQGEEMKGCPTMNAGPGCPLGGEITPEKKALCEKFMKLDSLSVEEQKEVLKAVKADIDQREAEMAAKKAEMEQKWANFDNLTVEEQKALIMMKSHCGKMGPKCGMPGKPGDGKHHGGPHHRK